MVNGCFCCTSCGGVVLCVGRGAKSTGFHTRKGVCVCVCLCVCLRVFVYACECALLRLIIDA